MRIYVRGRVLHTINAPRVRCSRLLCEARREAAHLQRCLPTRRPQGNGYMLCFVSVRDFYRAGDAAVAQLHCLRPTGQFLVVAMNKRLRLDEKLTALRKADIHRKWSSLDDRRVCIFCGRVITGRMIDIWQDKRGTCRLHCPTPGCMSSPRDWFYHGAGRGRPAHVPARPAPMIAFGSTALR